MVQDFDSTNIVGNFTVFWDDDDYRDDNSNNYDEDDDITDDQNNFDYSDGSFDDVCSADDTNSDEKPMIELCFLSNLK